MHGLREKIAELVEDALFLDPAHFDEAIIGIADRFGMPSVVAYDRDKVIEILAREMEWDDAVEWFEFNTIGAWVGETTPVFVSLVQA